ncbi:MAG: thiol-activated cytolysin family protein [Bacteroidota bacterium]
MKRASHFYILLVLLLLAACKGNDPCDEPGGLCDQEVDFSEVIASGGTFESFNTKADSTVLDSSVTVQPNGDKYFCISKDYDFVNSGEEYFSFNPNAEIIYPGSLLQGNSISNPTPNPIVADRGAGCFTINLINGSQGTRACVDEMKEGKIVLALNEILDNNNGILPAKFSYEYSEVQSAQEMAFKMGVNFSNLTADVKAKLSVNTNSEFTSYLINLSQEYFTMIYEKPTSYEEVFAEGVSPEDLEPFIQPGNPATYISSVTYGRKFYLLLESTETRSEIKASLKASYDAAVSNTELESGARFVNELSNIDIKVYAIGGDQQTALETFNGDFNAVANYLSNGGDYRTGVPLSYVVRSLETHQIVNVKLATQYQTTVCEPYFYDDNPPGFTAFWGQTFNRIGAIANFSDPINNLMFVFNLEGDQYFVGDQNAQTVLYGPYDVDDPDGLLGDIPFDKVSAARFDQDNSRLVLYNETGILRCEVLSFNLGPNNPATYSTPFPFSTVFSGHPFALFGLESAARGGNSVAFLHTKKGGNASVLYSPINGVALPFGSEIFPIETIGAASYVKLGPGYMVMIAENGRDYTIWDISNTTAPTPLYKF